MPGGTSLGLNDFGLTSLLPRSGHKRTSSGLLDAPRHDYDRLSTRRRAMDAPSWTPRRVLKWFVVVAGLAVLSFWWRYELHVELQLFSRGWVRESILPVIPSSSTCFAPSTLSASRYNLTLARAPAYVDVHAGINLPFGRDCYDFARTLPSSPLEGMVLPKHTIVHTYWRHDLLPLGDRQVALLDSILATQDRDATSVILWTNAASPSSLTQLPILAPLLTRYGARLSVRTVDKRELAVGTAMEDHALLEMADKQAWVDGDLVRILVLWQHGGIWVDFDTILTGRDLRVLGEHEWVTQWDCYDKVYQPLNGAMMHFYEHSPYLCEMLHAMATLPPPARNSVDWGARLYHKVYRSLVASALPPFKVLPYCFTDGVSCRLDSRLPDPFGEAHVERTWGLGRRDDLRTKVESVWAVHLHNRWDKSFPKGGWVDEMILTPLRDKVERYRAD
ncbi:hypothetical protein JCM10212_002700 [Sporobolomyces blumeae]